MTCKVDVFKKAPSLKGYSLVIAFPSTGLVGVIVAQHLIEKLNTIQVGCVHSDLFAPIVLIQDGLLKEPVRLYVNDKKKLAVLVSEQLLHKFESLHEFAEQLSLWIQKVGFKNVFAVSGILVGDESGKKVDKVYGVAVNQVGKKLLEKNKVEVLNEGISTGISPLILLDLAQTNIAAVQLLGEISYNKDYAAAASVVKKLSDILNLKVNVDKLMTEAAKTKTSVTKQIVNLEQAKEQYTKKPQEHSLIYG